MVKPANIIGAASTEQDVLRAMWQAGRALADARGLAPEVVTELLEVEPSGDELPALPADPRTPDDIGALFEALSAERSGRVRRKARGMFYTPASLVDPTVARTLGPLVDRGRIKVCDPAAGGGAFLLGAVRFLAQRDGGDRGARREALRQVHGVDVDPLAVRVARLALWLETGDPDLPVEELRARIRCGNSCVGAWDATSRTDADAFCARWFAGGADAPFHWSLEFPDVFARGGFDAIVGNPPWDIDKPDSRRFFATVDAAYPTYSKQEALRVQRRLLAADPELAARWDHELAHHKAFGRFVREAGAPFSRQSRGDLNRYKLFVELAWELLRDGGRLGLIVPSGLWTDAGCAALRSMLFRESRWEWLYSFENRRAIFPIDSRFKFAAIVAQRGATSTRRATRAAFMRLDPDEWRTPDDHTITFDADDVARLSPRSLAIPEVRDPRDLEIFEKMLAAAHPFGDEIGATIRYRRELDLTVDSHRFPDRETWEAQGFRADGSGNWTRGDEVLLPLYEGRMIGQFDCSESGWVRGRGRRAEWRPIAFEEREIEPQFLLPAEQLADVDPDHARPKIGFMAIASATNRRSMVAASLLDAPCGNSVPTLRGEDVVDDLCVLAVLNSFVFDFALRMRLGGINLNQFVLAECPMLTPERRARLRPLVADVAALSWIHPRFDRAWSLLDGVPRDAAIDPHDRTERRARIDAAVARAYGLDADDFAHVLRDTDHPAADLRSREFTRHLDQKGFWRVDRELPPEDRLPARSRVAFSRL